MALQSAVNDNPKSDLRLRIAFLISRADVVGGAQIHVRDVATALKARGAEVLVIAGGEGPLSEQLAARGVAFQRLDHLCRAPDPLTLMRGLSELRGVLKQFKPDILSTHSTAAGLVGRVVARSLGLPAIFTAHGWGFTDGRPMVQRAAFWLVERATAPLSAKIITVCDSDLQAALKSRLTRPDRLVSIPNAMPEVAASLRAAPAQAPPGIIMVARMSHWKDQPTLLRALSGLKDLDWALELVGDGPSKGSVEQLAGELGLADRIHFAGYRDDVPSRLAAAQVFVLATKWEGFPRAILEAMRAGLPVIASEVGGVRESVRDGENGYVVACGDVEALRTRLRALLSDPDLRGRMGAASRSLYEDRFGLERLLTQTIAIYDTVLGDALGGPHVRTRPLPT